MQKIPTLFLRNPLNMREVMPHVNPEAAWVLAGEGVATIKKDGVNVRVTVQNEQCVRIEKRRNPSREEKAAGAEPGYVEANRGDPADKHLIRACDETDYRAWPDGVYPCEALGPKIQDGVESEVPRLYAFTLDPLLLNGNPRTFDEIRDFLEWHVIEGIVWHHEDGQRMAKIKRKDFNLPWPPAKTKQMQHIMVKCCFCPGCFVMRDAENWQYTRRYTLHRDVSCPHCKVRIVQGRTLEVLPLSEDQAKAMDLTESHTMSPAKDNRQ